MSVIDTATNTVTATNAVGSLPFGVAVSPDGTHLYVANGGDSTVSVISLFAKNAAPSPASPPSASPDPATGKATATLTASDPDGNPITVTSTTPSQGHVGVVDNADGTWTLTYTPTGAARLNAALNPAAVTDSVTVTVTDIHAATTAVPVAPTVARGYFAAIDTIPAGSTAQLNFIGLVVSGNTGYVTNLANRIVVAVDLTTNTPIWGPVTLGSSPAAMAVSGNNLYVDDVADGTVTVLDKNTGAMIGAPIQVGHTPQDMKVAGHYLYVANRTDGTVSVIDTTTNTLVDTNTGVRRDSTHYRRQPTAGHGGQCQRQLCVRL